VQQILLRKHDGSYWLVLWLGDASYDFNLYPSAGPLTAPPANVLLSFAANPSAVTSWVFASDGTLSSTTPSASAPVPLTITDIPQVVKIVESGATPAPSPTPTVPPTADLASTLCVGGQTYTLDDHDWFDLDSTLSVSDTWPPPLGTEWSNRYSFGRDNNLGTDDNYYPSTADLASLGVSAPAVLIPGVGVQTKSIPVPVAQATNPALAWTSGTCTGGTCYQGHIGGLLANQNSYNYGYWEYSAQLPGGAGWWPSDWLLNMSGGGAYNEWDAFEQWGPSVIGANVIQQTEQPSVLSTQLFARTTSATADSAQHLYGIFVTPSGGAFYFDRTQSSTGLFPLNSGAGVPLDPIIQMQVCANAKNWPNGNFCEPAPAATASAASITRYYAHFSPPATPAPCAPVAVQTPFVSVLSGSNGLYMYGANTAPTSSYNQSNYWVDVNFTPSGGGTDTMFQSGWVPVTADTGPDSQVELGMQFQSSVAGSVKGIRFYKAAANTGTHTGHLWTSAGASLGTVTFSGETASGWQEADFTSPIAISTNTTYIASYNSPVGHYSADTNYFNNCRTAGPLSALGTGGCIAASSP
jgi:hypothetical protein